MEKDQGFNYLALVPEENTFKDGVLESKSKQNAA